MKNTPSDPSRNVSPYLLRRLRSVEEATAEIRTRTLRWRRDALVKRLGRDTVDEPVDA